MNRIKSICLYSVLTIVFFMCALNLDSYFYAQNLKDSPAGNDILYRIFGQLRYDLAAMMYLKADEYFHGGTEHPEGEKHEIADELNSLPGHKHAEHEHENSGRTKAGNGPRDLIAGFDRMIHYHPVMHLSQDQQAEVIPWFYLSAKMDPHYVNAYVLGGFWLSDRLGKPDEALKFLKKGMIYNPDAWQIYRQAGEVYFEFKKNYQKADLYLKNAYRLMLEQNADTMEKRQVLVFLSSAAEKRNDLTDALGYYRQLRKIWPGDSTITEKINDIEKRLYSKPGD